LTGYWGNWGLAWERIKERALVLQGRRVIQIISAGNFRLGELNQILVIVVLCAWFDVCLPWKIRANVWSEFGVGGFDIDERNFTKLHD